MRTPRHLAFFDSYFFDGRGKSLGDAGFETGSVGQQILGTLQPVHYGWFGGIGSKLIYGFLGFALTIVTQSGVAIWLARRRGKGRPAPVIERLWLAVTWGAPFALVLTALWSLHMGEDYQRAIFLIGLCLAFVLATCVSDRMASARILRIALGSLLLVEVLNHDWIWRNGLTDPAAIPMSVILMAIAFSILAKPFAESASRLGFKEKTQEVTHGE